MTDASLIERYLEGDVGAFNTLVWRWEQPLYRFIYRNVGNTETAKDLCQNTFIKTFKHLKNLKEKEKFSPWIYRIALNLCRDEFKRRKRHRMTYLEDMHGNDDSNSLTDMIPDEGNMNPEEIYHNEELGDILKRLLMKLPEEQRVVIVMKQYEGLKFTEIAEILEQPINTIKSRLYYALRALKKTLEKYSLSKEVLLDEV